MYDAMGQMAVEYSTAAAANTGTSYMFTDMLGSVRTITDQTGTVVENYDYLPFGRMLSSSQNGHANLNFPNYPDATTTNPTSRTPEKFTGKERDAETGLDFFLSRYYSAAQGRFMTPDWSTKPEPVPYANLDNPQTLNLYAYVKNNPLSFVDPDGHEDQAKKQEKVEKAVESGGKNTAIANKEKIEKDDNNTLILIGQCEADLVVGRGYELAMGVAIDTKNLKNSGVFVSVAEAEFVNIGISAGGGFSIRPIDGKSNTIDINYGLSPTITTDDKGISGLSVGGGWGSGVSMGTVGTKTFTFAAFINEIKTVVSSVERSLNQDIWRNGAQ